MEEQLILLVETFIRNRASRLRHLERSVGMFNLANIALYLLV